MLDLLLNCVLFLRCFRVLSLELRFSCWLIQLTQITHRLVVCNETFDLLKFTIIIT